MSKRSKAVIGTISFICLLIGITECLNGARSFVPPYREGQCFVSDTGFGDLAFEVVQNDILERSSVMRVVVLGTEISFPSKASFSEIRQVPSLEIPCN